MDFKLTNRVFILPNAKRMVVEPFGIRITDKHGKTVREYPRKEASFDASLSAEDRRLLSQLKIGR